MAIQREIWNNYIVETLFKLNPHFNTVSREDDNVIGGRVVHIPNPGAKPAVVINRSSFPATAAVRTDQDLAYLLDEFTSNPTHITNADMVELSYDKIAGVIGDHIGTLSETVGDYMIWEWLRTFAFTGSATAPAATVIRTTGGAVAAHLPSATGNRKKLLKEDLQKARTMLNKQNIPNEGRYALISSDMLDQLMDDANLKVRDNALELDLRNGVIGRLYGFNIIERSTVAIHTNAATPVVRSPADAAAGTDNDTVVCYQSNALALALGEVNFFERTDDPLYYGNIYSALLRMGARKKRLDGSGVIAIVQDASA